MLRFSKIVSIICTYERTQIDIALHFILQNWASIKINIIITAFN